MGKYNGYTRKRDNDIAGTSIGAINGAILVSHFLENGYMVVW
jgi:hypothetical protein